MEVCPDHVLESLREKRKWYLRAQAIDNETYKRAMKVSDFNKGKSVSDLSIKDWSYGCAKNMRSDSTWEDDRYDPLKYSHPHRYDNVNFQSRSTLMFSVEPREQQLKRNATSINMVC